MVYYTHDDGLYHHGIKGMKWGVRRYKNADGSLTPAGKKREVRLAAKRAKKESIARGKELHRQLTDPSQIRWNEDRNNRLIKKMTEKDWDDVRAYQRNTDAQTAVAMALFAVGGVTVVGLMESRR